MLIEKNWIETTRYFPFACLETWKLKYILLSDKYPWIFNFPFEEINIW